ncbi:globin domain-containing protein [Saccharothrix texasensis]|uniref:Hemoglobin-like flavoprotein n=1 Tax=Saccharothrix texasensis TaxID=103734 RepID=A0A3N1GXN2_9PSEU|nr:globin domain-containing protein [Saccharothrix texasensis]ROP35093.1 hemoglobin-like flavoprotein [Saccharothrix texasensis]
MLSAAFAEVVHATLPVVRDHAVEITDVFHPSMFAAHPELLDLFNQSNQAGGQQHVALASAVVAFAEHLLDHIARTDPTRRVVAHAERPSDRHALRAAADVLTWYEDGDGGRPGLIDVGAVPLPEDLPPTCAARCRSRATCATVCCAGCAGRPRPLRGVRPGVVDSANGSPA